MSEVKFVATKTLPMDVIRIDGGTQSREKIHTEVVDDYAAKMSDGEVFPAGIAFFDGKEYWLADGFHRYHALRKNRKSSMSCDIVNGTLREAIMYSYGANAKHGMPMTNKDKWRIVTEILNDFEWGDLKDREIARRVGVSHVFVAKVRMSLKEGEKPAKKAAKAPAKQEVVKDERPQINEQEERLQETIDFLMEENQKLTDQLATNTAEDPEFTAKTLDELRDENKQLRIEVKSLTISRDQFQAENAQLIKQVNYLTKKLKKLSPS